MFAVIVALVALALALLPPQFRKIGFAAAGGFAVLFVSIVLLYRRPAPMPPAATTRKSGMAPISTGAASTASASPGTASRKFDFDQYERDKKDREDPDAKTRIAISEVRFDQIMPIAGVESGTIQAVRARPYNDSTRSALTDYAYYLLVQDCLPGKANLKGGEQCTTVYDQREFASLAVPPNQARDVLIPIPRDGGGFAAPFKLLGTPRVTLTATATRAYQSAPQS